MHTDVTLSPRPYGEVLEWLNRLVSKTSELARAPRVRIPLSPPATPEFEDQIWQIHETPATGGLFHALWSLLSQKSLISRGIRSEVSTRQFRQISYRAFSLLSPDLQRNCSILQGKADF